MRKELLPRKTLKIDAQQGPQGLYIGSHKRTALLADA